jgi:DNA polymerase-3 subunit epsilon
LRIDLQALSLVVLDCQASGATPVPGDLLEIGWQIVRADRDVTAPRAYWVRPATDRPISRPVRRLTGWDDACLEHATAPLDAWRSLREDVGCAGGSPVPTVIHFARFELPFLRDLHSNGAETAGAMAEFPFDVVCLHAIAIRLMPDLPRLNLRALAGHLGHSPTQERRALGHVEASTFIWRALVPLLSSVGVEHWDALKAWLVDAPAPSSRERRARRVFPMPVERRRALPDAPGVYRFLRPNGDILYIGKATSLKKRVASYFTAKATRLERTMEMLSQAHDIKVTQTSSAVEAALLETDEIKRIDAPYNVQLRARDRSAWFASRSQRWGRHDSRGKTPLPKEINRVIVDS